VGSFESCKCGQIENKITNGTRSNY